MVTPLQIISINSLERAKLYQIYTKDFIVVVQQERKMRHPKANPSNDHDVTQLFARSTWYPLENY